jgi:hypothetical protein
MKFSVFGAALIVFTLLVSCAPGALNSEPWARTIFAPSASSEQNACDAGFEYGQSRKQINLVGGIRFNSPRGLVLFNTRLGKLYFLCNSIGLLSGRKPTDLSPVFSTDVMLEDKLLVGKIARVAFSLEDAEGKEIARLNASARSVEDNRQWYKVAALTSADQQRLTEAKSFTIIVNRGDQIDERYKVTQTFTPLTPTNSNPTLEFRQFLNPEAKGMLMERSK